MLSKLVTPRVLQKVWNKKKYTGMKDLMKVGVFEVTTTLFHKCANGRKRKNNIISLENDGQVIKGDENLLKHAFEYIPSSLVHRLDMRCKWTLIFGKIFLESLQVTMNLCVNLLLKKKSKML